MTSPRHAPRDGATRTLAGHEPRRSDAVVRQRLRAVAGGARPAAPAPWAVTAGGRPVLDWEPATGALPAVPGPSVASTFPGDDLGVPGPETPEDDDPAPGDAGAPRPGWLPERPVMPGPNRLDPEVHDGSVRAGDDTARTAAAAQDDLALRARRRAATTVAQAYAAAHGHPTQHSGFEGLADTEDADGSRPRVAVRSRVAVAAAVLVLAVAGVTSYAALRPEPVAALGTVETAAASEGDGLAPDDDAAEAGPEGAGAEEGTGADGGSDELAGVGTGGGAAEGTPGAAGTVVVHVVGQVAAPGLVTVVDGARVADALAAAGGTLPEADVAALNIARTVVDGEQIVVPRPGETVPASAAPGAVAGGAPGGAAGAAGGVVDLNAADAATLDALPGIGPVLAERIVAWRTEHGRFTSVDELGEVSGIGPAILADLRDMVRV